MSLYLGSVVLDVRDMKRAVAFWSAALGYKATYVSDDWSSLTDPNRRWANVGLQPNPDPKGDVNRVHLDLFTTNMESEVERLVALGAKRIPWEYAEDANYVVLQDPEGNELCVVQTKTSQDGPSLAKAG
jgi:predicted enzyme related to lactoylglutathione lyase